MPGTRWELGNDGLSFTDDSTRDYQTLLDTRNYVIMLDTIRC